jgi:hypothetical protein
VRYGHFELAAQTLELATLLPGLLLSGMRDHDHLVRAEVAQLIFESDCGVWIAASPRAAIPCSRAQVNERSSRVRASASPLSTSDIA